MIKNDNYLEIDKAVALDYMAEAIKEAKMAYAKGEVPVGAVIVKNNIILAKAHNTIEEDCNPLHHAEINVIEAACAALGYRSLHECELYVTMEPCPMCAGAIMQARVGKLFFGAFDDIAGAVVTKIRLLDFPFGNRKTEYSYPVMEQECRRLLTGFFTEVRSKFLLYEGMWVYKLSRLYFDNDTVVLAKALLGAYIIRHIEGERLVARIVEAEAYCGIHDKGSHSYGNNRTERTETMYGPPGHAYIYLIYGMYHCLNFITQPEGTPSGVLIRSVEPVEGLDKMAMLRYGMPYDQLDKRKRIGLTNGPGKLSMALGLTRRQNGMDLSGEEMYVVRPHKPMPIDIVTTTRVNIDYAEEAVHFPWRFYIRGNEYVSKK